MLARQRLAANLNFLFTEVPFLQRFERAAAAGFTAVELGFDQYDHGVEELAQLLKQHSLSCVLLNTPKGQQLNGIALLEPSDVQSHKIMIPWSLK